MLEAALAPDLGARRRRTIRGLTSTSRPFVAVVAFMCPVTSTTTIRTSSPSCVAASPTQCPNESIVSSEVGRHARDLVVLVGPSSRATCLSAGCG